MARIVSERVKGLAWLALFIVIAADMALGLYARFTYPAISRAAMTEHFSYAWNGLSFGAMVGCAIAFRPDRERIGAKPWILFFCALGLALRYGYLLAVELRNAT
jgi:hypothetical protein